MPQLQTITLNDGLSTPVARAFIPVGIENGVAKLAFRDPSNGHLHLDRIITLSSKQTGDGGRRVTLKVLLPVVHNGSGSDFTYPDSEDTEIFNCSFKISQLSDLGEREDLLAFATNLLASTEVQAMVENAEGMW